MEFSRQEYWSGWPFPPPGDLPEPGIEPCLLCLLHWQADSLPLVWDGWVALLSQWTWVWANSRWQWRTGKPGVLQSMGSQRGGHNWVTEQQEVLPGKPNTSSFGWGFSSIEELKYTVLCLLWGRTRMLPEGCSIFFLAAPPLSLDPHPSLISNCLNLPLELRECRGGWNLFPTNKIWKTQKSFCLGAPQSPARVQYFLSFWMILCGQDWELLS